MYSNEDATSRSVSNFSNSFSSNSESFCFAEESIPNVSFNDQELLDLGVNTCNRTQFETEIISPFKKALKGEEEHNRVADANKELHFVEEDIQFIKNHLNKMEKTLHRITVAYQKQLAAIKKEQENKLKQMKKLETKRKALQVCISGNVEEVNTILKRNLNEKEEIDEETLYHLERASTAKETEEERLIRTGEMTPFGTVIKNQTKDKPKPKSVTISSNSVTELEAKVPIEERSRKNKDSSKSSRMSRDSLSDSNSHKTAVNKKEMEKLVDDGNEKSFLDRIRTLVKSNWLEKQLKLLTNGEVVSGEDNVTEFEEGYKIPNSIWNKLCKHQQTGVHWLWELHQKNCGGIVGDEMGLGKTIQVIAFLIGLSYSNLRTVGDCFKGLGPVILVCPATVMHQWVKEFHTWWPIFRVAILHQSGSFVGKKEFLIQTINKNKGILITSYTGIVQHQKDLLKHEWHYVILDEGHKICNPDAQATLVVKQECKLCWGSGPYVFLSQETRRGC
ncbi:DNA excision repair protein ERCC-6 [Trichonephila clavipes]|uniref:DNA excision repair protein ERCC-6 n=1 Tax=Trichonephila clavipes TaxID=2585209 RepID=A0A8X6R5S9_TRICX|nr:DNA excision repair protein ERCC-6 [Trichonephila clavipes]